MAGMIQRRPYRSNPTAVGQKLRAAVVPCGMIGGMKKEVETHEQPHRAGPEALELLQHPAG